MFFSGLPFTRFDCFPAVLDKILLDLLVFFSEAADGFDTSLSGLR